MNGQRSESVSRRITGRQTLFATTAVAAAVITALHFGMSAQNANAAVVPLDKNIPPASVQIAPPSFSTLIEAVQPAVVSIASSHSVNPQTMNRMPRFDFPEGSPFQKFFEDQFKGQIPEGAPNTEMRAMGSGFIVDPEGFVVTNNHVVDGAGEITVILQDGTRYTAMLKGRDPKTDLALLKIEAPEELPYVRFGDSDKAKVGDWVVAVGNPFGLGGSVSAGIISARGRDIQSGPYDDYLQIDAPINRGNYGGPLFDASGKVVGVNTAIFSPTGGSVGIGFAVPSSLARPVIAQLQEYGRTRRGWLGVRIQPVTEDLAEGLDLDEAKGALIAEVTDDSPAEAAGLAVGDVVLSVNDKPIGDVRDLTRTIARLDPGEDAELELWRQGETASVTARLGAFPEPEQVALGDHDRPKPGEAVMGMRLAELDERAREAFDIEAETQGVLITSVRPDSWAARKGLRRGDVIVQAGQAPVSSPAEVAAAVESARQEDRKAVLVLISRQEEERFVTLPLRDA